MIGSRIMKPALAVAATLALGGGAALAQEAGGNGGAGSGKAEPRIENTQPTMKGMDQEYGAPLQRPDGSRYDTPQYPETPESPAYQDMQQVPENPGGPIQEPVE